MIAKRILRDKPGSDFSRLAKYVVDARGQDNPATWTRTADYILDTRSGGAKVGGVRVSNCDSEDIASATLEIMATQAKNTRSKRDKTYHLVASFPPGERPPIGVLHAIEDYLVEAIGLADHQRISAIHTDTEHLHIHIAINQVHPTTYRNVEPYFDQRRLMAACELLEVRYGLTRTDHGLTVGQVQQNEEQNDERAREREREYRAGGWRHGTDEGRRRLRESYHRAVADGSTAEGLDDMRAMPGLDMVHDLDNVDVLLPGDALEDMDERRSQGAVRVRRTGHGHGRVLREPAGLTAHGGRESLVRWAATEVGVALRSAERWGDVHDALAKAGLRYQLRGDGAVITTDDGAVRIRASDLGRDCSKRAMEGRLGTFSPPVGPLPRPTRRYREGVDPAAIEKGLWARYSAERARALTARRVGAEALRAARKTHGADLAAYYAQRRAQILATTAAPTAVGGAGAYFADEGRDAREVSRLQRAEVRVSTSVSRRDRKALFEALSVERRRDAAANAERLRAERQALHAQNPLPTWLEWLQKEAARGDAAALEALRRREAREGRFVRNWLRATDEASARSLVLDGATPRVDKHGRARYAVGDGGEVCDHRAGVEVTRTTDAAIFLALTLAAQRYEGQALIVDGSDEFKTRVARVAGGKGMAVAFADPAMERERVLAQKSADPVVRAGGEIEAWIEARNARRGQVASILPHRRWGPADAGSSIYQGRRKIGTAEALLLEREGAMLVLPVSAAQAAKASTWVRGAEVTVDTNGRLMTPAGRMGR